LHDNDAALKTFIFVFVVSLNLQMNFKCKHTYASPLEGRGETLVEAPGSLLQEKPCPEHFQVSPSDTMGTADTLEL